MGGIRGGNGSEVAAVLDGDLIPGVTDNAADVEGVYARGRDRYVGLVDAVFNRNIGGCLTSDSSEIGDAFCLLGYLYRSACYSQVADSAAALHIVAGDVAKQAHIAGVRQIDIQVADLMALTVEGTAEDLTGGTAADGRPIIARQIDVGGENRMNRVLRCCLSFIDIIGQPG